MFIHLIIIKVKVLRDYLYLCLNKYIFIYKSFFFLNFSSSYLFFVVFNVTKLYFLKELLGAFGIEVLKSNVKIINQSKELFLQLFFNLIKFGTKNVY